MEFLLTKLQVNLVDFDSLRKHRQNTAFQNALLFVRLLFQLVLFSRATPAALDKKELNKSRENIIKIPEWTTISNYN